MIGELGQAVEAENARQATENAASLGSSGNRFGDGQREVLAESWDLQGLASEIVSPLSANGGHVGSVLRRTMR